MKIKNIEFENGLFLAPMAGVADRVGSLAPGKDADITVTSAHPLNWLSRMKLVVMDGRIVVNRL